MRNPEGRSRLRSETATPNETRRAVDSAAAILEALARAEWLLSDRPASAAHTLDTVESLWTDAWTVWTTKQSRAALEREQQLRREIKRLLDSAKATG